MNYWLWGLFFYTLAMPIVFVANVIYFIDLKQEFRYFFEKVISKKYRGWEGKEYFITNNDAVREDMLKYLMIFNDKIYHELPLDDPFLE